MHVGLSDARTSTFVKVVLVAQFGFANVQNVVQDRKAMRRQHYVVDLLLDSVVFQINNRQVLFTVSMY